MVVSNPRPAPDPAPTSPAVNEAESGTEFSSAYLALGVLLVVAALSLLMIASMAKSADEMAKAPFSAEELSSPALAIGMSRVLAQEGRGLAPRENWGGEEAFAGYAPPPPPAPGEDPENQIYGLAELDPEERFALKLENDYAQNEEEIAAQEEELALAHAAGDRERAARLTKELEEKREARSTMSQAMRPSDSSEY